MTAWVDEEGTPLAVDARVRVTGMLPMVQHLGMEGTVVGFGRSRVKVKLDRWGDEPITIKPQGLVRIATRSANKPTHTPHRNIRISDEDWAAAQEGTAAEGTNVSAVVNAFLRERYGKDGVRTKSRAEIEAKVEELHARCRSGKIKQTGIIVLTSEIRALEWVLGIPDTVTDEEHTL